MTTKLLLVAAVIILMMLGVMNHMREVINVRTNERDDALQMANDSGRLAKTYMNQFGREVSKNKVLGSSYASLKAMRDSEETKHLKQFEGLKKDFSNLETSIRLDAEVRIKAAAGLKEIVYVKVKGGDSIQVRNYQFNDKYNQLWILTYPDSADVVGNIQAPTDGVVYWQREHKFLWFRVGKKIHYSEFTSPNPWVSIPQQEVMVVRKR